MHYGMNKNNGYSDYYIKEIEMKRVVFGLTIMYLIIFFGGVRKEERFVRHHRRHGLHYPQKQSL